MMTYIDPTIHMREAIWMAVRRESRSAMNEEARAPNRDPNGIAHVIPP
jgi:hypothetical protein